jgi:hypothetical protein
VKEWNLATRLSVSGGTVSCDIAVCREQSDGSSELLQPVPLDIGRRGYGKFIQPLWMLSTT